MKDEPDATVVEMARITPAKRGQVRLWAMLVVLFATTGVATGWMTYGKTVDSIKRHRERMNPQVGEGGTTPPPPALAPGANPVRVQSHIYVDRIVELSVREAAWTVDFSVWFRWTGQAVDPGREFHNRGWVDRVEGDG